MPETLKIAACQMRVCDSIDENAAKISEMLFRAKSLGASLAVFPECAVCGYPPLLYKSPDEIPIEIVEAANARLGDVVAQAGIAAVVGTIVKSSKGDLLNSALIFEEDGHLAGRADKIHMFKDDAVFFKPGNEIKVFELCGIKTGVPICYDIRFPEQFRLLKDAGAELVIVPLHAIGPESWKLPVFEGTFRTRAAENVFYLAAINAASPNQTCASRICDTNGVSLAEAAIGNEEIITADLDLNIPKSSIYADRRTDLYEVRLKSGN